MEHRFTAADSTSRRRFFLGLTPDAFSASVLESRPANDVGSRCVSPVKELCTSTHPLSADYIPLSSPDPAPWAA